MGTDPARRGAGESEAALHAKASRGGIKTVLICHVVEMSAAVETLEAMERPPVTMASRFEGELLEVSMGPQHPSTHGVFRMNVALDGEIVRKLKPVFGYLHRNP